MPQDGVQFVSDSPQCVNQVSASRRTQRNQSPLKDNPRKVTCAWYILCGCEVLSVLKAFADDQG